MRTYNRSYDLLVVGAGPAGVAGALAACLAGLRVAVVDSGARVGGQYFRHLPDTFHAARPGALHHGFDRFVRQSRALHGKADVLLRRKVWAVERADGAIAVHVLKNDDEQPETLFARKLLIATGAHDRPLPFPGWDLPGVLTAGGAQALLKGNLVVAGRRVVVAGTGAFLLPVATGLAQAGAQVLGVYEANGRFGLARHPFGALGKAGEAAGYGLALLRHRVPYKGHHAVVAAHGERELTHVTVARLDRDWNVLGTSTVECDALAVGYGFVPQLDLPVQLGCDTHHDLDGSPVVTVGQDLSTSVEGVYAAGEPTGVGGAALAEVEGRLAGLAAAGAELPAVLLRRRERLARFAGALHAAYPVREGWQSWLADDTLICRCEEVPLRAVREAQELGATDARSVKLLARPGMGWCQGRICGYAVSCLAGELPQPPRRPIAQPIPLGSLERIDHDEPG